MLPAHQSNAIGWRATKWLPWAATATALAVLALTIAVLFSGLRQSLQAQLARRDAQILAALLEHQASSPSTEENSWLLALIEAAASSQIPGVESLVLFDSGGSYFATLIGPNHPAALDLARVKLVRQENLAFTFEQPTFSQPKSKLRVTTSLKDERDPAKILAFAEFELDGSDLSREFVKIDSHLLRQAFATFLIAGTIMCVTLIWAFRALRCVNRELAHQSELLRESNRQLLLAAKTSAIGALTSNLMHGLKNPLAALQHSIAALGRASEPMPEVADAKTSMKRMRGLIDDVVRVLRDEAATTSYRVPISDIFQTLQLRAGPYAAERLVGLKMASRSEVPLHHRQANVALLVLENLLINAIQASSPGAIVSLHADTGLDGGEVLFSIADTGPGLPENIRSSLFAPLLSAKPEGSGLGLALSHQLALQLGGSLDLVRTGPDGTVFRLRLPVDCPK